MTAHDIVQLGLGSCKPLRDNRSCIGALCRATIEPSSTGGSKPQLLQELVSAVGKRC